MSKKKVELEDVYVKLSHKEQILTRPDTYIGSVEKNDESVWVFSDGEDGGEMVKKPISYTPGLFKIFDEILVNASDNFQRDTNMDTIKVNIVGDVISVYNNGKGIPIEIHKKEKMYIPELIFGHLLTSSNYRDDDKKVTGGRNGYGAKLANIFSNSFEIETSDGTKVYKQRWTKNMDNKEEAIITEKHCEEYTKVTFTPDYARFQMKGMEEDTKALLIRRAYDIAGCNPGKKVYINKVKVCFKRFEDYAKMYVGKESIVSEQAGDRWEVCVCASQGEAQQVSFVNSIFTSKGGTHVDIVLNQICKNLMDKLAKKNKKGAEIKPFQVKNHLFVFVRCLIENPAFDSQTKETLKTQSSKFGSKPVLSDKFFTKLSKLSVMDDILNWAIKKGEQDLSKSGGRKTARITGIPKLDDANKAGTKDGKLCTLILTEGDSAKTLAVSGLSVVGRDYYGVFPLRGKPLNAREISSAKVKNNQEFENIAKIMGLRYGKKYTDLNELRYGCVMIMADQDYDGSHIKGLLINYFNVFWPSLLKIKNFLVEFITPIVKVKKGKEEISFFTVPQFNEWKEEKIHEGELKKWEIKYYKGLGTSKDSDAKVYFGDLDTHKIRFDYNGEPSDQVIDLAFSKKRADDRKEWLKGYDPNTYLDQDVESVSYQDFVHKELILFSYDDCERSIPCVVDGLKPSQRKVLWTCLIKNVIRELKVSQLSGLVSEKSSYHHGEVSLQSTIVNMAQNFCGANNINLLLPSGQFGSRLQGGKDQAAARYIYTRLSTITRSLCIKEDDQVLDFLIDEDRKIEPKYYVPIIPMVLVNGAEGIGTGWSTDIPNFNPLDLVDNCKRYLNGEELQPMKPWYRGWTGELKENKEGTGFMCYGRWRRVGNNRIEIRELPMHIWTENYKVHLEKMIEAKTVKGFQEHHLINTVHFVIDLAVEMTDEQVWNNFKLASSIKDANMHLFNSEMKIQKYHTPLDIMREFCEVRLKTYEARKKAIIDSMEHQMLILSNKVRFIKMVIEGKLIVNNRKKNDLYKELISLGFDQIKDPKKLEKSKPIGGVEEESVIKVKEEEEEEAGGYDYLLSMKIWTLTYERAKKLMEDCDDLKTQIDEVKTTTVKDMWLKELASFEKKYPEWLKEEEILLKVGDEGTKRTIAGKKGKSTKKTRKTKNEARNELLSMSAEELARKFGENAQFYEWKTVPSDDMVIKRTAITKKTATKKKKDDDTSASTSQTTEEKKPRVKKEKSESKDTSETKEKTKRSRVKKEVKEESGTEDVAPKKTRKRATKAKKIDLEDEDDGFVVDDDEIEYMSNSDEDEE
ncbi:DNA topoisomerase, putative [Entamoeba invadens IP1]|uniref:DNA topoisomerase 2 n=1 Tax=Entamoeba invadens IP1 TaxID=370355 RepID=L7FL49_ENTIV|nr:DNA topoisomerase, putative [Entamoeba invadens IP1]ELP87606.1 DNA topoisomerase, putative [Entamoeba invadens IP1]|eukprot:XP_004254377.1 DNA topoisomerase, putative [Entamoeba invadens IP1]